VAIPGSLGIVYCLDKLWTHPGDVLSDDNLDGSCSLQPHTESTAGQPLWLLRLVGGLQRHSGGKLTTLNKGFPEPLGCLISDGDDEKMIGEMSIGEII
jgi:hypothetical protein